jgi:hypothetical protein
MHEGVLEVNILAQYTYGTLNDCPTSAKRKSQP